MTFAMQRSGHSDLTQQEIADGLAIRELVDASQIVETRSIMLQGGRGN
jgi:hypothetical protein